MKNKLPKAVSTNCWVPRLERVPLEEAEAGDIVIISGIEDIGIGVTITDKDNPKGLPMLSVDEPTLTMDFYGQHFSFGRY